jgi:hypothetical protein
VLTGLLAAQGLVIAIVLLMTSLTGLVTANRPARTGSSLAGLGILCSLTAIVVAVAAVTGSVSWLTGSPDEIDRMHLWLLGQRPAPTASLVLKSGAPQQSPSPPSTNPGC